MKFLLLVSLFTIALCYDDILDFNFDVYSQDIPLLQRHLDCYLDKGPCDPVPQSIKRHLKEIFDDACHECNDIQKHHGHQFMQAVKDFLPEGYIEFKKKYDKDGKHFAAHNAAVENY